MFTYNVATATVTTVRIGKRQFIGIVHADGLRVAQTGAVPTTARARKLAESLRVDGIATMTNDVLCFLVAAQSDRVEA